MRLVSKKVMIIAAFDDSPILPPPSTVIVDDRSRLVLFRPDGVMLVRESGYDVKEAN